MNGPYQIPNNLFFPGYAPVPSSAYEPPSSLFNPFPSSSLFSCPDSSPHGGYFPQTKPQKGKLSDESMTYEGEILNGKRHGKGVLKCKNGNTYEGFFRNGLEHGKGILTYADGGRYEGDFFNGMLHGLGVKTWPDGSEYDGEFKNNFQHGSGMQKFSDGRIYNGQFVKNKFTGIGTFFFPNGEYYSGHFVDGSYEGRGILKRAGGDRYEGYFRKGKLNGKGTFTSYSESYTGQFQNGKFHGHGILKRRDGLQFEGSFHDGKFGDTGKINFPNGDVYEGQIKEEMLHGKGVLKYKVGHTYAGDFLENEPSGVGMLTYSNGNQYNGNFLAGKPHGQGVLTLPNGVRFEGQFEKGKKSGEGIYTDKNGTQTAIHWISDQLTRLILLDGTELIATVCENGDLIPFKMFLNRDDDIKPEHKTYLDLLEVKTSTRKAQSDIYNDALKSLNSQNFSPSNLSLEQIDSFSSYVQSLSWFKDAPEGSQQGILCFIREIKTRLESAAKMLLEEGWKEFGCFVYLMDHESISDSKKKNILNLFQGIHFACSDSIPERIKYIVQTLISGTTLSDLFLSQRNMLFQKYIVDYFQFRSGRNLSELSTAYEIHAQPWLANLLDQELNFHTGFTSKTDLNASRNQDATYLGYRDTGTERVLLVSFFASKINHDTIKPTVEDMTAYMTALLYPFKDKTILSPKDFEQINETVFDVLDPVLSDQVREFDDRLELYFTQDQKGNYSLNDQIFVDIKYLCGKYLEHLEYYQVREAI